MKSLKKRNHAIIVLVVLLIAIAVGYASFTSTLTINGTATGSATWNVRFTSARLLDSTGAVDSDHGTVSISQDGLTVDATGITLDYPGDAVKLETVISNLGTLDAKLRTINVDKSGLANTDITVTEAVPTANEVIEPNKTCTSEFVIQWNSNSTKQSTVANFSVTFTYDQDTNTITFSSPQHSDGNVPAVNPGP